MTVIPFDIARGLGGNRALREDAEAAWLRSLERRARDHGVAVGGRMTLVQLDSACRVNVVLTEHGSDVTMLHGQRILVEFRRRAVQGSDREIVEKTTADDNWRAWAGWPNWHRLDDAPVRLNPVFRPRIVQPGMTSSQGSSLLPLPGKRQDRRSLRPVIARRLQTLWNYLDDEDESTVRYVENGAVSVVQSLSPYGIHCRIKQQADGYLMLTGLLNSDARRAMLEVMTWKKGFEDAFLSNEPWSFSVHEGVIT